MVWYLEITNSDYTALQWAALLLMLLLPAGACGRTQIVLKETCDVSCLSLIGASKKKTKVN